MGIFNGCGFGVWPNGCGQVLDGSGWPHPLEIMKILMTTPIVKN